MVKNKNCHKLNLSFITVSYCVSFPQQQNAAKLTLSGGETINRHSIDLFLLQKSNQILCNNNKLEECRLIGLLTCKRQYGSADILAHYH